MNIAPQPSATRSCILLVDDNRHGLVARKALLEELGYRIETASSGEEALERFAEVSVNVVVTDFKLPRMDGAQLIRKLRVANPDVRVIMLSGFVEPLGLTEETTGADVVISKSAGEVRHLIRSLGRLLHSHVPRKPATRQSGKRPQAGSK
jgi:CheY-like chemotaxis protein